MPRRIPTQTVIVYRDGKQVVPPIGEVFDFTREEVNEIKSVAPDALRLPINEENLPGTPEEGAEAKEAREAKARADQKVEQGKNAQSSAQRSQRALHLSGREGDKAREEGEL